MNRKTGNKFIVILALAIGLSPFQSFSEELKNEKIVILVPNQVKDAQGGETWKIADDSDEEAQRIFSALQKDGGCQKEVDIYRDANADESQKLKNLNRPLYIKLLPKGSGAYAGSAGITIQSKSGKGKVEYIPNSDCRVAISRGAGDPKKDLNQFGYSLTGTLRHEIGHTIMYEAYGRGWPISEKNGSTHTTWSVMDEGQALTEGWAEFINSYYGGGVRKTTDDLFNGEFKEAFINKASHEKAEGVVDSYFMDFTKKLKKKYPDEEPLDKVIKIFQTCKPNSAREFHEGFCKAYPQDKDLAEAVFNEVFLQKGVGDYLAPVGTATKKIVGTIAKKVVTPQTKEIASKGIDAVKKTGDKLENLGNKIGDSNAYKTVSAKTKEVGTNVKGNLKEAKKTISKNNSLFLKAKNFLSKIFKGGAGQKNEKPEEPPSPAKPKSGISADKSDSF